MFALLIIIYISFISLGLPDSLLGSAWPVMHKDLSVALSLAGVISMIISCGTVVSSFLSTRIIKRFGTGVTTAISVTMTAVALIGISLSNSFFLLCLWAIPLGLGAGSVDAALNNFVAIHYKAKHMNWLHCFWGIGATSGPMIMSLSLKHNSNWHMGYLTIGIIQSILVFTLIVSLPLWKRAVSTNKENDDNSQILSISFKQLIKIPNAKVILLSFFCYCALELTTGLWAGSYAVTMYNVPTKTAATWTSIYYFGITFGRFISGFISTKFEHKQLIRMGQIFILCGILLFFLPLPVRKLPIGLAFIGFGCAPIYPSMLHQTPKLFGTELSQAMMGVQMAFAYVGSTFMPPIFGLIAGNISIKLLPLYLIIIISIMMFCTEYANIHRKSKA